MQLRSGHKLIATPKGILLDDKPLNKFVQQELSPYALRYIKRAGELLKQVSPEDWDKHIPHHMNDVPELAKAQMMLALANPIFLNKYSADQPRDWRGRWTDGSADTSTSTHHIDHRGECQVASSGAIMTDAPANNSLPKTHVLSNAHSYIGKPVFKNAQGHAECVEFAQQAGGAPLTRYWTPGGYISAENPPSKGTWVATFVNGKYYGHVGVFNGYDKSGALKLVDQFRSKKLISETTYHVKPKNYTGRISNDPSKYQILKW